MYTLYGHEGATTSANFSPGGDYFISGGNDSVVLCWESNMNQNRSEQLDIKAKIETELFVTQKEKVDKLPTTRGTKMGKSPKKKVSLQLIISHPIVECIEAYR
jgi:WD40 repeat protein